MPELRQERAIGRADDAALREQHGGRDRDDHGRDLAHQPVADRQDRVGLERRAHRHVVDHHADHEAHHEVQERDQQPGDRIALHEFRGTVERAEEGGLLLLELAPLAGLLVADRAGGHVAVDGELLAGHRVEREARAHLGHAPRTLGDHDEVHDQEHAEHHQPEQHRAAHDEHREALDHVARRPGAGMALADDELRGGDVERQPQHQAREQDRRKGREIERALDEERVGEDQDRQRERRRQPQVEHPGRHRQHHHHDDRHQRHREQHRGLEERLDADIRGHAPPALNRAGRGARSAAARPSPAARRPRRAAPRSPERRDPRPPSR